MVTTEPFKIPQLSLRYLLISINSMNTAAIRQTRRLGTLSPMPEEGHKRSLSTKEHATVQVLGAIHVIATLPFSTSSSNDFNVECNNYLLVLTAESHQNPGLLVKFAAMAIATSQHSRPRFLQKYSFMRRMGCCGTAHPSQQAR